MAMLCFGHICRIHRTLDKEKVLPILGKGLKDKDEYVRGAAENALNDIEVFYERPCDQ
jgi:3-methyladenine DNA glycosylase AlkC